MNNGDTMKSLAIPPALLKEILKQGISYVIIAGIAWVFFNKSNSCNERLILMYEKDRQELIEARAKDREDKKEMLRIIENHTKMLESFYQYLENRK